MHGFCYRFWFNRIVLIFKRTAYSLFLFNTIQFITFYILELEHYYSTENWNSENENCGVRIDFDNGTLLTCSYHIYIFFIVWCHSYLAAVYCLILTVPILVHEGIAKHTHTHTHIHIYIYIYIYIYMKYLFMFMRFTWQNISTSEFCLLLPAHTQTTSVINYFDIKFHGAYGKIAL